MVTLLINRYIIVCIPLRASQWCNLSKAKIQLIWVTLLIIVNSYIIVCIPLRASEWCTLTKKKIPLIWMMLCTDCRQPVIAVNRYIIVCLVSTMKGVSMVQRLEGEDSVDVRDATDRRQPLIAINRYIIVCLPLRASQWCTLVKMNI